MARRSTPDARYAPIIQSVAGTTVLVPGVAGRRIVVLAYCLTLRADGTAQFLSASTPVSGAFDFIGKGGAVVPEAPSGHFETGEGEALNLTTTGGAANGHLTYTVED